MPPQNASDDHPAADLGSCVSLRKGPWDASRRSSIKRSVRSAVSLYGFHGMCWLERVCKEADRSSFTSRSMRSRAGRAVMS